MPTQLKYRLLMVDDDPNVRVLISMAFAANEYEVKQAGNGVEALPLLKHMSPHVMISDLHMPEMDGYELMRITRRFFPEVGVIALSGDSDPSATPGTNLADAFFAKGAYKFDDLLRCVTGLVARYPLRSPARLSALSPSWLSPDKRPKLWTECSKCERTIALKRSSKLAHGGVYGVRCSHCGFRIKFLVEQRSLDAWSAAA